MASGVTTLTPPSGEDLSLKAVPGIGPGAYSMIRKVLYNSGPQGYCGDEDNGQTSPGGKKFVIHAENASEDNCYIRSETLNGKNCSHNFLKHEELMQGGELKLSMDCVPDKERGVKPEDAPYSYNK